MSNLIAGSTAAALGYDVNTAVNTATIAVQNNALADDLKKLFRDSAQKAAGGTVGAFLSLGQLGLPFVNSEERAKMIEGIKILANSEEPLVLLKLGLINNHKEFQDLDALMSMNNDTFGRAMVDAKYTMDIVQMLTGVAALPKVVVTSGKLGVAATGYVINGTKVIIKNGTVRIAKTTEEIKFVNEFIKSGNGEGLFSMINRGTYTPETNTLLGQLNNSSCAAASCKMAAGLYDIPEAFIRSAIKTADDGTILANIPSGLKALGFRGTASYSTNLSLESIQTATQKGAAVILNVRTETGGYHAIVVDAVKNGQVYIRDPWPAGTGSSYSVPVGALQSVMTGKGVVVQRF